MIIFPYTVNWLVFIAKTLCVYRCLQSGTTWNNLI